MDLRPDLRSRHDFARDHDCFARCADHFPGDDDNLADCNDNSVDFASADFSEGYFSKADFSAADFSAAELSTAELSRSATATG